MFEKTIEAQALDASSGHLSPYSFAVGIHVAAAIGLLALSFVIIPIPNVPDPPEPTPIFIRTIQVDEIREDPAPAAAPPRRRGSENPGPVTPPKLDPPVENPPVETPPDLPGPLEPDNDTPGPGEGAKGDPLGVGDGPDDGVGIGPFGPGGGDGTGTKPPVELTPEMVRPVLLHKVSPVYPEVPRKARIEGRVTVQAVIGLDGSVESVDVLRSSNPFFDEAALSAVKQWRYRPATMNGVPVRVYFTVEVGFVLR